MQASRITLSLCLAAALAACGGSSGSSGGGTGVAPTPSPTPTASPTPTPTPTSSFCSLSNRQDYVRAALEEWYLFPDLLNLGVNKASHTSVQSYIDALVAPARAQSKDRFFTYITSIEEENAFFERGANIGFGFRLTLEATGQLRIMEAYEGAPAFGQGMDRGTEILAIGQTANSLQSVGSILAAQGVDGLINALGPDSEGVTRVFRIQAPGGPIREVTVTKTEFEIPPISSRYGALVLDDGGRKVGYLNLRTFIDTSSNALANAFATFQAEGVSEMIIDLRYNGGGLITVAETLGDLLGAGRQGQIFSKTVFRASKAQFNESYSFQPQGNSIAPTKIAFITTDMSASASELVINSMRPYLGNNIALIGSDTFGKPVGQIALDQPACDDRLRVVALQTNNRDDEGDYYTGLAGLMPNTCRAEDDVQRPLGDPSEASVKAALDFLAGRSCTAFSTSARTTAGVKEARQALQPRAPSAAQRELPGLH